MKPTRARRVLSSFPRERARSLRVRSAWRRQSKLYSAGRRSRLRRDPRRPPRRSPPQRRRTPTQPTRARRVLSSFPRERARSMRVRSAWRRQSKLYSAGRRSRLRRDPRCPPPLQSLQSSSPLPSPPPRSPLAESQPHEPLSLSPTTPSPPSYYLAVKHLSVCNTSFWRITFSSTNHTLILSCHFARFQYKS